MLKEPIIELEESIEVLKKGKSVKIDEFVLVMSRKEYDLAQLDRLKVNGYLFHKSKNDIPKETIKDELESVKNVFHQLLKRIFDFGVINIFSRLLVGGRII